MGTRGDEVRDRIREIFIRDWDPSDVSRNDAARGNYDGWIEPMREMIRSGAGEDEVIRFLKEREAETMCFPGLGVERLRPVARKLIRAVRGAVE